jgi:hypothetical protein
MREVKSSAGVASGLGRYQKRGGKNNILNKDRKEKQTGQRLPESSFGRTLCYITRSGTLAAWNSCQQFAGEKRSSKFIYKIKENFCSEPVSV